jgi:hypothetical protein
LLFETSGVAGVGAKALEAFLLAAVLPDAARESPLAKLRETPQGSAAELWGQGTE